MFYVNFDLETTGHSPDHHAIIQLGAVAHSSETWEEIASFEACLAIPDNRVWDPDTKNWWETSPDAGPAKLLSILERASDPGANIRSFLRWLKSLPAMRKETDPRVAFVANPIAFDFALLSSYLHEYVKEDWLLWARENHAAFGGVDLPTLAMAASMVRGENPGYPDSRRTKWPDRWRPAHLPYTHLALDDARVQAFGFVEMMKELQKHLSTLSFVDLLGHAFLGAFEESDGLNGLGDAANVTHAIEEAYEIACDHKGVNPDQHLVDIEARRQGT